MHADQPSPPENVPGLQAFADDAPDLSAYIPAALAGQGDSPAVEAARPCAGEYLPASQALQLLEPAAEYVPGGQSPLHTAEEFAPVALENFPAAHEVQAEAPL